MNDERSPCVYILASGYNGTLYVGVTSDLVRRVVQHRVGAFSGFTAVHGIRRLVYFEMIATMDGAIAREKQLKRYRRDWKRNLIERENPAWNDLGQQIGLEPLNLSASRAVGPGTRPG
ncbi:GIY-YIG nuclease family protein [Sphingomonas profundi]|uniref:GIY-YIG nuclease family protein n=1 Tax=Alterirhizorhabdus profundi TaxID=2681549 RepID=UPI0012E8A002|nr:GIY-YIG nuclease family protein [Sphingomonas profundi]